MINVEMTAPAVRCGLGKSGKQGGGGGNSNQPGPTGDVPVDVCQSMLDSEMKKRNKNFFNTRSFHECYLKYNMIKEIQSGFV